MYSKDEIVTVRRDQYKEWCKQKELNKRTCIPLPTEILSLILEHCTNSQSTLYHATLVSKQWLFCATPFLYKQPHVPDTYRWATFVLTLTRPLRTFAYGQVVRSLDLSKHHLSGPREPYLRNKQCILDEYQSLITVSTSSLLQITQSCSFITHLNLSDTCLLTDQLIVETGEYLSTLQYAVRPGLTQIEIPINQVIQAIGCGCPMLQRVDVRQTRWITAQTIWLFVNYCPRLRHLDARRSPNCNVKRLTLKALTDTITEPEEEEYFLPEAEARALNIFQEEIVEDPHSPDALHLLRLMHNQTESQQEIEDWPIPIVEAWIPHSMDKKSLKELVRSVITDARNIGVQDLDWLDEYQ
ncbi:hypothetical protein G6F56_005265 [Rhizopus delemar]|nr:hypothetical protein G6F56_005265 [Rhizopus delemar]